MTGDGATENETKKPRIKDASEEDRQRDPDTVDEEPMEEEDGADSELGPMSPGMLLALLRRSIREKGVAKKSDQQTLESKVEQRLQSSEKEWNEKFGASEERVQEIAAKVDSSIMDLGAQMSKLESCVEAMADRSGSKSSTASPTSWAGRGKVRSDIESAGGSNVWSPKSLFIRGWPPFGCPTNQTIS